MDSIRFVVAVILTLLIGLWVSQALALSEADFQAVGRMYGISPFLLRAIGTIETRNGELLGKHPVYKVIDDTQLKYLEKIARHTERAISEFKGSHAGAMGYMQIMPSTFYTYAQDGDGDSIRDPLNPYDSLATAAYYLARSLAIKKSMRAALKKYNNSESYCNKVLALYRKLELDSRLASSQ